MSWKQWILFSALSIATVQPRVCWAQAAAPVTGGAAQPAAEPPPTTQAEAEFRELYHQWQGIAGEMAQLQAKLQVPSKEKDALESQKTVLIEKANAFLPKLQAAAEKAFLADDKNQRLSGFLFTLAASDLQRDNPEEALRLANLLLEHNIRDKDTFRIAASAAFATMDLDTAEKMLLAMGDGKMPTDPETQSLLAAIKKYRPMWEREQKLRAAEAKADDLPRVKLTTTKGDITVELFENEAPNTVASFVNLVDKKFYDGVQFHRVLPGFMAQGGDPLSKDPVKNAGKIGSGGPGYTIPDECFQPNHREHFRGSLSMAHTEAPNSGGSQFFMMFAPSDHLDGKYSVFGRVIDGIDVLAKLQRVDPQHPTNVTPDKILKAEVLRKRNHPYEPKTIPGG